MSLSPAQMSGKVAGRVIRSITLLDDSLTFRFDNARLILSDRRPDCCEYRYLRTDDDLHQFIGASIIDMGVSETPQEEIIEPRRNVENPYHTAQFLRVLTTQGVLVISVHNDHNGYYEGITLRGEYQETP